MALSDAGIPTSAAGSAGASLRNVAVRAGVSAGTVSNVLNHPDKVSPKTAKKVFDAIEELGFVRNEAARQLRQGRSRSVGLIVLDVANPFFTDIARGVEDQIAAQSRTVLLADSAENADREQTYLDLFEEHRVDGLLISPVGTLDRLDRLRARGMRIILVDRFASHPGYSSVAVDDVLGGRLAVEHLIDVGCRTLAFVGASTDIEQVANRLHGARAAAREAGLGPVTYHEVEAMNAAKARATGEAIARMPAAERPDGVFAANDLIALGLLQAFTIAGLRMPEDIALIGYDDIDYAESAATPLSSIRQPAHLMGTMAADLLAAEIAADGTVEHKHVVLEPELVARASTRGPSA